LVWLLLPSLLDAFSLELTASPEAEKRFDGGAIFLKGSARHFERYGDFSTSSGWSVRF